MSIDAIIKMLLQFGIPGGLAVWLVYQLVSANRSLGRVIAKKDDQYSATVEVHAKEQAENTETMTKALVNNTNAMTEQGKTMNRLTDKIERMAERRGS